MKTVEEKAIRYVAKLKFRIDGDSSVKYIYDAFLAGYNEAMRCQSSPKVKQLEWGEVNYCGKIGINAETPFGDYEVYEKNDHAGYILWWFDPKPYVFDTKIEAKMYAQADFERRVMECLE